MAEGTGVAVAAGVGVGAGIVEVAFGGGDVGMGACLPPQPVSNKPAIVKRSHNVFIRTHVFLQIPRIVHLPGLWNQWQSMRL